MTSAGRNKTLAEMLRESHQIQGPSHSDLWAEEPVTLDVFVKDRKFLKNPPLYPRQYEIVREMERIFFEETAISMVEDFGEYWMPTPMRNFLYICLGKGSGKDHALRIGTARVAYLLTCLKEPQAYYSMAPQDVIHTINVATTAPQARRAFFTPLGTLLSNSKWFQKHITSEITPLATSIRLDSQIEMVSGHSLAESFEGLNPILSVADEIAAFRAEQEMMQSKGLRDSTRSAEAIMKVLRSSARSRYPKVFKLAAISYTRYKGDPIETLMARGKRDIEEKGEAKSRYFCMGPLATWEVNPKVSGPEDFEEDYKEDPLMAKAMYECKPERSTNRFFKNDAAIDAAFPPRLDQEQPLEMEYYWDIEATDLEEGQKPTYAWQVQHQLSPDLIAYEGAAYAIHADLAVSGDRAGVAMAHVRSWQREESEERQGQDLPVIKVDFVTSYESDLSAETPDGEMVARETQLRWFRKLVRELIERGFSIQLVTLDGWQSVDTIQIIQSWGIDAAIQSMDRTAMPYTSLRDVVYDGRLEAYNDGIIVDEIEGLTRLRNGKIDHPADGSKDEADALCGAVIGALALGGEEGTVDERQVSRFDSFVDLEINAGMGTEGYSDLGLATSMSQLQM
jgi:hypothetical protein